MVPHWTIPNAIALGNCLILKPSELVPLSAVRTAELLAEAGLPAGVFNVVHGDREVVEAICDHPGIAAVTFVGSTKVAKIVYRRGTATLKRVLALGGAKNHLIVLPDADPEMTSANVVASMSGCTGQRCMAASVMVAVGVTDHIVAKMVEHARTIVPGQNLGPVISPRGQGADRALHHGGRAGGRDGAAGRTRYASVPGRENGFYVGPTILDHVRPTWRIAQEEVFGPVLAIVRVRDVDQALAVENASPYGNAASVFTESGGAARYVTERASAGMVGVNVGVPVPAEPFSFGGWNESKFGVGDITGHGSIEFWTRSQEDHDQVEPRGRHQLDVLSGKGTMTSTLSQTAAPVRMPAFDYTPRPYHGPSRAEVLAARRAHANPALFTLYREPLMIVEGKMQYVFDETGRRYLDLFAGIVTVSCGHSHPHVVGAGQGAGGDAAARDDDLPAPEHAARWRRSWRRRCPKASTSPTSSTAAARPTISRSRWPGSTPATPT